MPRTIQTQRSLNQNGRGRSTSVMDSAKARNKSKASLTKRAKEHALLKQMYEQRQRERELLQRSQEQESADESSESSCDEAESVIQDEIRKEEEQSVSIRGRRQTKNPANKRQKTASPKSKTPTKPKPTNDTNHQNGKKRVNAHSKKRIEVEEPRKSTKRNNNRDDGNNNGDNDRNNGLCPQDINDIHNTSQLVENMKKKGSFYSSIPYDPEKYIKYITIHKNKADGSGKIKSKIRRSSIGNILNGQSGPGMCLRFGILKKGGKAFESTLSSISDMFLLELLYKCVHLCNTKNRKGICSNIVRHAAITMDINPLCC